MKKQIIVVFNSIDPLVKREVLFVVVGTSIGLLIEQLVKRLYFKRLKKGFNPEDPTLPKSKLRQLRGGQVLEFLIAGNEIYAFIGGVLGFVGFLATLNQTQLHEFIKSTTMLKPRELALMPPTAGIPVGKLKDITCSARFKMLEKILEDDEIPFKEKKEAVNQFFKRLTFKKRGSRVVFLFCIINLLVLLYYKKFGSFYLSLAQLRKMFRSGRISQVVYYTILRRLKKIGIPVDDELEEVLSN